MILNGFDRVAFIYDWLAQFVFGRSIVDSQKHFLNKIPDHSKVLILGGGSGWLLAELFSIRPNCDVWYIEASKKMISLSKQEISTEYSIHFIHGTEHDIPSSIKFDLLITNFYLDLFTNHQLEDVVKKIQSSLNPGSLWLVTDFVNHGRWWQKIMLRIMYLFFRLTCRIESNQLPEWNKSICKTGFRKVQSKFFYSDFIETALYQR